jgi:hypothetical protein
MPKWRLSTVVFLGSIALFSASVLLFFVWLGLRLLIAGPPDEEEFRAFVTVPAWLFVVVLFVNGFIVADRLGVLLATRIPGAKKPMVVVPVFVCMIALSAGAATLVVRLESELLNESFTLWFVYLVYRYLGTLANVLPRSRKHAEKAAKPTSEGRSEAAGGPAHAANRSPYS